jgi:Raf kinase inhibitor-like YbhB/YbcL family protein
MTARVGLIAVVFLGFANSASAFEISSPSVSDRKWDGKYHRRQGCRLRREERLDRLELEDPPAGTKSYVLTMFDPDAGGGAGWWHWQVWNIPASATGLREGAGSKNGTGLPKGRSKARGPGRAPYQGPCPPPGSGLHHYVITLYAMKETKLHIEANAAPATRLAEAMGGSLGKAP